MESSVSSRDSRQLELRFSCKPSDFGVEILAVTTPTRGNGDDYVDLFSERKPRSNSVDTEVSLVANDVDEIHYYRRFHELNGIASYDEDECLIWCTESLISTNSFDQSYKVVGCQQAKQSSLKIQITPPLYFSGETPSQNIKNKNVNVNLKDNLEKFHGERGE